MDVRLNYYTLDELLTTRLFRIPHYQRAYSWQDQHRDVMFNDIRDLRNMPADSFHFMATVLGEKSDEIELVGKTYHRIDIVDGQQRITTLVILLKAIEQDLSRGTPEEKERARELQELLVKGDEATLILLRTNHDLSQHFDHFLRSAGHQSAEEAQTLADRELLKAIVDCESFVRAWNNPLELLEIIQDKLTFVYHEIDHKPAVYTLFETLNDRGLDVSWLDKLKTRLMGIAFADNRGNNDEHIHTLHNIWGRIYAAIGLRQDLSKEALTFGAILISEERVRKSISEKNAVEYLMRRSDYTTSGAIMISDWILEVTEAFNKFFQYTNSSKRAVTKITHARLLGLAIMMRDCSIEEKEQLLEAWERATFRIFGLCRTDGRKEKSEYVSLAWETLNAEEDADEILTRVKNLDASYSINEALIKNKNCYQRWTEELRYLLFRYEEHLAKQKGRNIRNIDWINIWKASASRSVEHILPQSKGSRVPLDADQEGVFVHRLGNLLLLPLDINSELGNKEPEEKASRYQETGFLMAAEVGKTINEKREWGVEQIEEREQKLIEWICEEWG